MVMRSMLSLPFFDDEIPIEKFNSGGLSPLGLETKFGVVMAWFSIGTISVGWWYRVGGGSQQSGEI